MNCGHYKLDKFTIVTVFFFSWFIRKTLHFLHTSFFSLHKFGTESISVALQRLLAR